MKGVNVTNGSFSARFAKRKEWKVDETLFYAIRETIPNLSTVNDIGAGIGLYVQRLIDAGYDAVGYDGIPNVSDLSGGLVREQDVTMFDAVADGRIRVAEWAISIEVGEHIPLIREQRFVKNLASCASEGLIISWATLGQRGRDHVNCHLPEYVAVLFFREGWHLDEDRTLAIRKAAGKGWDRKLLVFRS